MENKLIGRESLQEWFDQLIGKKCWSVVAGKGTGSHMTLAFGEKIIRAKPLTNPKLSFDERRFESEYSLFVEECAWRVQANDKVACGSTSSNDENGEMLICVHQLIGATVVTAEILRPANDLHIEFSNGWSLLLFCNQMQVDFDNYSFGGSSKPWFIVGAKGVVRLEPNSQGS